MASSDQRRMIVTSIAQIAAILAALLTDSLVVDVIAFVVIAAALAVQVTMYRRGVR